jgi:hypothetical protein
VVALAVWSETLRAARIKRLVHFSIFRPLAKVAGTNKRSGHARGLAIDVGQFVRDDGEVLDVEKVWTKRRRGARPCRPIGEENVNQSTLRGLVCSAARQKLFQVILTPHHDRAHRTHVHLELRPRVDWDYIR